MLVLRFSAVLLSMSLLFSGSVHAFSFGAKTQSEKNQKLEQALEERDLKDTQKWLEKGANAAEIFDGQLALWLARNPYIFEDWHWDDVETSILNQKPSFEVRDEHGNSVYHLSTNMKLLGAAQAAGVNVDAKNHKGETALFLTLNEMVHLQFKLMQPRKSAESYYERSSQASRLANLYRRASLFLGWGAQIDTKNAVDWSPLDARDEHGNNILHGIASTIIAEAILNTGFPVDQENDKKETPLYYVFPRANGELVRNYYSTPDFRFGSVFGLVDTFLEAGADTEHTNLEGKKPFEGWNIWRFPLPGCKDLKLLGYLIKEDRFDLIERLSEQVPFHPAPIFKALERGFSLEEIRLMAENCDLKTLQTYYHGELGSVVHAAVRLGRLDVAKMFHERFDLPLDANAWGNEGKYWFTPLAAAFLYAPENQDDFVAYYVSKGQDVVEVAKHLAKLAEERGEELDQIQERAKRQRRQIWGLQAERARPKEKRDRARHYNF